MAVKFRTACFMLACLVGVILAILDKPCSDQYTDCDAGECCASVTGAAQGFKGTCQKYKSAGQSCTPGVPKDRECECPRWMICAAGPSEDPMAHTCQIILPGR